MSILPLASPGQAFGVAAAAGSAASLAGGAFADLLSAFRLKPAASKAQPVSPEAASPAVESASTATRAARLQDAEEKVRGRLDSLLASFCSAIRQALSEKGVDVSQGVTLEGDSLGSLRIVGDNVEKGLLETTLAGRPELAQMFQQIEANASLLDAIRQASDPNSIDGPQEPLRVRVDNSQAVCLTSPK